MPIPWLIAIFMLATGAALADDAPAGLKFWIDSSHRQKDGAAGYIDVNSWTEPPETFDAAMEHVRTASALIVRVHDCRNVDPLLLAAVAGRLTPYPVTDIMPSGSWQWDKPLIVAVDDTKSCPLFMNLGEQRWAEVLVGADRDQQSERANALIRRYKRERIDRMEDMFRK